MARKFFLTLFLLIILCSLKLPLEGAYKKPADISTYEWNEIKPYLIPEHHKVKKKLDKLFTSFRVTENKLSIEKAGFLNSKIAFFSQAIISKNKFIDGYYFKFYSDEQEIECESKQWIDRAFEAKNLQKIIDELGYKKYFVVPQKWIYLIPSKPLSNSPYPKHYILVAKRIDILKRNKNHERWMHGVTSKQLDALWVLIEKEGLVDSTVPHNIPFTKKNKIAFIDLEQHHKWPVPAHRLLPYINPDMRSHWQKLLDQRKKND